MRGGANTKSLVEYQLRSIERWPLSVKVLDAFERDRQWCPFEPSDARHDDGKAPRSGREYFVPSLTTPRATTGAIDGQRVGRISRPAGSVSSTDS